MLNIRLAGCPRSHPVAVEILAGVFFSSLLVTLILLAFGCAGQLPPSGGPADTSPPEIVRTFPPNNATNVETAYLEIEFSELVDRRSVQESIFISPPIGSMEFDWSGRRVKILFSEALKKDRTYVVNIGTDVVDSRAGNRMATAHTLAFSTGEAIDPGVIEGRVYDDKPEGLMIFAYRLDALQPDTLNPSVARPDYVTQTGKGGLFGLNFIALGTYRLYAVKDEYRNLLYDPEVDAYGVLSNDLTLASDRPAVMGVRFRLAKEDTSGPILVSAKSPDRGHLEIRFNEPVRLSTPWRDAISVLDTLRGAPVEILSGFPHALNPELYTMVTSMQESSAVYRMTISRASDYQENPIQPAANTILFQASDTRDQLAPRIVYTSFRDSTRNVPFDDLFEVQFDDAVQRASVERSLMVGDSSGAVVPGQLRWVSDASIQFQPVSRWKRKMWYTVTLATDSVVDLNGNRGREGTWTLRFETMDDKLLSSIEGTVIDPREDRSRGSVVLTARSVMTKTQELYTVLASGSGAFRLSEVPEGMYVIDAYRDEDANELYTYGRPYPFRPSERFTVYPDTIKVRARWPLEGVKIELE